MNAKLIDAATLTKTLHHHHRQQQQQQQQQTQQQLMLLQPTVTATTTTTSATFAVRKIYASVRKRIKHLQQQQQQQQRHSDEHFTAEAAQRSSAMTCAEDRDLKICLRGEAAPATMKAIRGAAAANCAADDTNDDCQSSRSSRSSNSSSSHSICLICRHQLSKCCLRCCQHLLSATAETQKNAATPTATPATIAASAAPPATSTSQWSAQQTDNSRTCSCRHRVSIAAAASSSSCRHCQHCLTAKTTTHTTLTTAATPTCCCHCQSVNKVNDTMKVAATATETMTTSASSQTSLMATQSTAKQAAAAATITKTSSLPTKSSSSSTSSSSSSSPASPAIGESTTSEWQPSLSCSVNKQILPTTAAETMPITATAPSIKIAAKHCKVLLFNAIVFLQFLLLYLQSHVLHLFKWRRRSRQRRKRQHHSQYLHHQKWQQQQHHSHHHQHHHQQQHQQPNPPCNTRLRFNCNSYKTESTLTTIAIEKTTTTTTSHQQHFLQRKQQQQKQHPSRHSSHHLQQPNYSVLYIILIALSFLSTFLPSTQAQTSQPKPVTLTRNETVCKSLDIRNTPNEFNQLRNCTVIEGFLLITLLNTNVQMEITETFPLLTEVTEYIMIYRVHYLRSLAQIFPNLSIIRGRELFEGYALTVYSNPHLEELGLSKLITISRGGVRIENNLSLCFVNTIDWSQIVTNTTDIIIEKNRADIECPQCPGPTKYGGGGGTDGSSSDGDVVCKERQGRRHCWNSKQCQIFCPDRCRDNCIDENTCCNEACLGGCAAHDYNVCNSCRHFSINNSTCIDKCPNNFYTYLDRRCITAESCARIGSKFENNKEEQLVPYDGQCSTRCPEGYNKVAGTCRRCGDKCEKHCPGGLIDSVARAKEYHGCTHITESGLTISIKRGGRHLMEDLEFGLSSIEVIETYLKVHRTYGMFSLEYFKNLRQISGKVLCEERFALYMLENNDLETIWRPNQTVRIEEGRVFFHFNPKLCVSVIESLRPMMKHNATFDKNEVATDSNGSKGSCNTEYLNTTIFKTSHTMAIVDIVNPLVFEDERTFIGYQYFYMEDKYRNATKHGHRPCDDGWTADEPTKETRHVYTRLKPFTQYAYYVKTMTISSEPRNAQSPIQYFKTKSAQPKNVRILSSYANSSSEIVVNWLPPTHIYGNLTMYKVRAKLAPKNPMMESRNYCKDPLKEAAKIDQPTTTQQQATEKPLPADCKCLNKDGLYDDEKADANIHDSIDFENTVQNFVYVKQDTKRVHPNSSMQHDDMEKRRRRRRHSGDYDTFLLRHIRALEDELDEDFTLSSSSGNSISRNSISRGNNNDNNNDNSNNTLSTTTIIPSLDESSNSSLNLTRMDANEEYFVSIVDAVNATTTEYVFQRLKHFSVYVLDVEACREPEEGAMEKECSDLLPIYVRTLKRDDVDKVQNLRVQLENTNTSRSNIRLRWDPPESPNGAVVSYTISYEHQTQDAVEEKRCITDLDYQNLTNGYVLSGLPTGNYSIRVRANSLAGEGVYSEYVYIFIPPTSTSPTVIALICIGVLSGVAIFFGFFYYCRKKILVPPSELKMFPSVNPYYDSLQYIPDEWEVPRERIIQLSALGQGSFGMVYEGILKGLNNSMEDTACAIKTVNENATDRERMNFLNEASVMKQFDTYHVVRLLGVCSRGQPALVIMELMKNGDLKSYLRAHRPDERDDGLLRINELTVQPPPLSRIYQMAIEIADGMAYLSAKKFVHRDLAARNCMVAADLTVKIGDFGMTRDIYETDYYRKGTKGLLPVRWMPPESLRDGVYSSASDVFSYGVVLWEMATLASQPYQGLSNDQVLRYVIDGGIMERPENCPEKLYRLMEKCWHHRPTARPTFMGIIGVLLDHASDYFQKVSFYHSSEGVTARNKELQECMHQSGDIFHDHDNDMDDVTTPLRVGEYNEYKLNMENTSSVENPNESPAVDGIHHPHSPYSIGSGNIISSTPDGKNSYNHSQISHNNQTLSSAPSTSAGIVSGGGISSQLHQPHLTRLIQPRFPQQMSHGDDAAYVQPDYDPRDFRDEDEITLGRNISKSADTDDRGYQVYDPSPNYREHAPYGVEDEEITSGVSAGSKLSGAQNLLPKRNRRSLLTIIPISSSMPDEAISVPMASSLHPSTGSAASSNTSSNAATGAVGKYPSLKKAVSETVQSVGNSLVPQRLRNMNRFFNHKRSGSNTSHKSTGSNANPTYSNTNLASQQAQSAGSGSVSGGRGRSISGSNLGTIESGGSGSGGSYVPAAPRFFKSSNNDNPNYNLLNESANASGITVVDGATPSKPQPIPTVAATTTFKPRTGFSSGGSNPNYKPLNESLNTSVSPTRPPYSAFRSAPNSSINPNYELMQAPRNVDAMAAERVAAILAKSLVPPNYVMMSEPQSKSSSSSKAGSVIPSFPPANLSENPNYQMMGPAPPAASTGGFSTLSAALRREPSAERFSISNSHSSHSATASSSSEGADHIEEEEEDDDEEDEEPVDGIKMERIPLSRSRRSSERRDKKQSSRSRSRSQSQAKSSSVGGGIEEKLSTPTTTTTTTSSKKSSPQQTTKSSAFTTKEKWLQQQSLQKQPQQPPNGFIGREG